VRADRGDDAVREDDRAVRNRRGGDGNDRGVADRERRLLAVVVEDDGLGEKGGGEEEENKCHSERSEESPTRLRCTIVLRLSDGDSSPSARLGMTRRFLSHSSPPSSRLSCSSLRRPLLSSSDPSSPSPSPRDWRDRWRDRRPARRRRT